MRLEGNEKKRENNLILLITGLILALIFIPFWKYNFASPWTDFTGYAPYYLASWVGVSLIISFFAYLLQIKFELWTKVLLISYIIALIFVPPLYFDIHLYSCFDISKVTSIYLLTSVILATWIIRGVYLGKIEISIPPLMILLPTSAWLIITFLSTLFSINPWMAFVGTYKRYEGLLVVIMYFISFYAILTFISKEKLYWLFLSIILVAAMTSVYGVIQFLGLDPLKWESFTRYRIIGTFGNPVFIAAYLSMAIFTCLSMYIFIAEKKELIKKKRQETFSFKKTFLLLLYGGCLIFIYICFCFTNTRATFVGLSVCNMVFVLWFYGFRFFLFYFPIFTSLFGLVFYLVYQYLSPSSTIALFLGGLSLGSLFFGHLVIAGFIKGHKIGLPTIGASLIFLTIIFNLDPNISVAKRFFTMVEKKPKTIHTPPNPIKKEDVSLKSESYLKSTFQKIRDKLTGSAEWRIWMWTTGCAIIPDYPWFGIGPDTLGIIFPKYLAKVYKKKMEGMLEMEDRLHNEIFDTAVNRGIIGLFIYFWLIIAFTIYCWRGYRAEGERKVLILGIYTAWLAYLIQNQFSFGNTPIASLYWILMAIAVKEIGDFKSLQFSFRKNSPIAWVIYPSVFALLIAFSIFVIRPYLADLYYKDGTVYSARGDWNNTFSKYKKAISFNYREIRYWEELNRAYINHVITTGNKESLKEAIKGANTLNKLLKGMSNTAYFTLGIAHFMQGDAEKALFYYKKAKEWQPFIADIYNNMGILYLNMGRPDLAKLEFEQAIEIRPEYSRTVDHLVRLYLANNEIDRATTFLTRLANVLYGDDKIRVNNLLAWIYYHKKGDYKNSLIESQKVLEIAPNDIDANRNIALCYYRIGDLIKAKEALLKLLSIVPDDPQAKGLLFELSKR